MSPPPVPPTAFVALHSQTYTDPYFGLGLKIPAGAVACQIAPRGANHWIFVLMPPARDCAGITATPAGYQAPPHVDVDLSYNAAATYRSNANLQSLACRPHSEQWRTAPSVPMAHRLFAVACEWVEGKSAGATIVAMAGSADRLESATVLQLSLETTQERYAADLAQFTAMIGTITSR
jgi:hypothetical protein